MTEIELTSKTRAQLQGLMRKQTGNAAIARRARCVWMAAHGTRRVDLRGALGCDDGFVTRWTRAFAAHGVAGLRSVYPGRPPKEAPARRAARVLQHTLKRRPADGATHWSSRKLAAALGDLSFSTVQRLWRMHEVRPHRLARHMVSNDPDFETKAADVIGLYLQPPQHALVFCVDEKTAIQALDRQDRQLPLAPGRAESHGFEYKRNGTLSLFAALKTADGAVLGKTAARHTSENFVEFLDSIVAGYDPDQEIHVVCDNVSSHKTLLVQLWLDFTPNVHLHYTPTYSSWLNQIEIWFSKIQRDIISRGVFTSTQDLDRKLMRYIREHNKHPKPIQWKYNNPKRRITVKTSDSVD